MCSQFDMYRQARSVRTFFNISQRWATGSMRIFLPSADNSSSQLNVNEMQASEEKTYQNISQPEKRIFRIRLFP